MPGSTSTCAPLLPSNGAAAALLPVPRAASGRRHRAAAAGRVAHAAACIVLSCGGAALVAAGEQGLQSGCERVRPGERVVGWARGGGGASSGCTGASAVREVRWGPRIRERAAPNAAQQAWRPSPCLRMRRATFTSARPQTLRSHSQSRSHAVHHRARPRRGPARPGPAQPGAWALQARIGATTRIEGSRGVNCAASRAPEPPPRCPATAGSHRPARGGVLRPQAGAD